MKKLLLISNPQFTWVKLDDQPRDLEHWVTVEQTNKSCKNKLNIN